MKRIWSSSGLPANAANDSQTAVSFPGAAVASALLTELFPQFQLHRTVRVPPEVEIVQIRDFAAQH